MSTTTIDTLMEQASQALVATHYLDCERLCLEALSIARAQTDFERYARILLPLQEARRLRRQLATDAGVFVLGDDRRLTTEQVLDQHPRGCLMLLNPPYSLDDERSLRRAAIQRGLYVEPLVVDQGGLRMAFEQQMEREGDAALASIPAQLSPVQRVDALAAVLERVGDHEFAHQRLAEAARAAAKA
jgi:hypothetical protein